MNVNIAYFVGVSHTDASICKIFLSTTKKVRYRVRIEVGEKSLPMIAKVQEILRQEFNRKVKIHYEGKSEYGTKMYYLEFSFKTLLPLFSKLEIDKETIPSWIEKNQEFFCSYLAGLIDGDGDVCIKRPKYPQCRIRITSENCNLKLVNLIKKYLNCSCWVESIRRPVMLPSGRRVIPKAFRHCFYLSSKNSTIFKKFVYPHIQIYHKKTILQEFLMERIGL